MLKVLEELFSDKKTIKKIQTKLPELFHIAEIESSRAGKIGMEVGSLRERIIVALLIYKFGEENVETEIPITQTEVDVKLFNNPISIKTISNKNLSGVKLIWTVDRAKAIEFTKSYIPSCDIILVQILWDNTGMLCYIPIEAQEDVFKSLKIRKFFKLPKENTNPRGVEITSDALNLCVNHENSISIPIKWIKKDISYSTFERWVDLWKKK